MQAYCAEASEKEAVVNALKANEKQDWRRV